MRKTRFKRSDVQFESLFPLILSKAINETDDVDIGPERKVRRYVEYGQGVRISSVAKDLSQGTIEITNQPLDMAVDGRGFFNLDCQMVEWHIHEPVSV